MNNMMMMDPNQDRSNDMMPTQSPFMRYVSPYPTKTSLNAPLNRELTPKQKTLPENLQEAIKKAPPFNRKNKFCGGMSKPYSKKK